MRNTDKDWENIGASDPYYGVLSHDRFRTTSTIDSVREEFFESGEAHIAQCFEIIKEKLDPTFQPGHAFDFGCGVGRLTIPLARRVGHVTALDVSESMLMELRKNCQLFDVKNVTSVKSDDQISDPNIPASFDFIHSYIVFQHIPAGRGEKIFSQMLSLLREGGYGAIHFTYTSTAPSWRRLFRFCRANVPLLHNFINLLQGRSFWQPLIQMNHYNLGSLFGLLQKFGCNQIHIRFTDHSGHLGVFIFFKKAGAAGAWM